MRTLTRLAAALLLAAFGAGTALPALAANPDFSGTWELRPDLSTNLGMMSAMKITLLITQTPAELTIRETAVFQDQPSERTVRYDLAGRPVSNHAPMGGANETVARWVDGRLVVTWTGEGSIAGTKVVRTETRSLGPGGRTMSVESVRGAAKPVVMVYERKT